MEIDRRSLMKGMLAGGALLAFGIPSWTFAGSPARRPNHCVLLLGGTSVDEMFENGARAACVGMTDEGLQTERLKSGLLAGTDRMVKLLQASRGARWIAVMDDASAVIFLELVRVANVRLLSMGTHAYSRDSACSLRHAWATTSPAHSVGGVLASQFIQRPGSFSITETFLQAPLEERALTSWSAPGFSSYRSGEADAMHIHCSGLSLSDGCELIGLTATDGCFAPSATRSLPSARSRTTPTRRTTASTTSRVPTLVSRTPPPPQNSSLRATARNLSAFSSAHVTRIRSGAPI